MDKDKVDNLLASLGSSVDQLYDCVENLEIEFMDTTPAEDCGDAYCDICFPLDTDELQFDDQIAATSR